MPFRFRAEFLKVPAVGFGVYMAQDFVSFAALYGVWSALYGGLVGFGIS